MLRRLESEERRAIGRRVARARRENGLSQRGLAKELGVTVRTIQNYESGRVVPYRHLHVLDRLAGKPRGWILDGDAGNLRLAHDVAHLAALVERNQQEMTRNLVTLQSNLAQLRHRLEETAARRERARGADGDAR
jgi:transcriptional regulator with XRE-family HTH domain